MLLQVEDYEPVDINHRRHLREHGGDWHHQRRYQLKGNIFRHILKLSLEIINFEDTNAIQNIYKGIPGMK